MDIEELTDKKDENSKKTLGDVVGELVKGMEVI